MNARRGGFSAIEMLMVVVIGGILLSMVIPAFGRAEARRGARNARDTVFWLSARARAAAIERGVMVRLEIDPVNDRAWILRGADTLDIVDYSGEFEAAVSMENNAGVVTICYTPRGFAKESCNVGTLPDTVSFERGAERAQVEIRPLGQVISL